MHLFRIIFKYDVKVLTWCSKIQEQPATLEQAFLVSHNCFIIIIIIVIIIVIIIIIIIIIIVIIIIIIFIIIIIIIYYYYYHDYNYFKLSCQNRAIRLPQGKNGLRAGKTFRLTLYKLQPKGSPLV